MSHFVGYKYSWFDVDCLQEFVEELWSVFLNSIELILCICVGVTSCRLFISVVWVILFTDFAWVSSFSSIISRRELFTLSYLRINSFHSSLLSASRAYLVLSCSLLFRCLALSFLVHLVVLLMFILVICNLAHCFQVLQTGVDSRICRWGIYCVLVR